MTSKRGSKAEQWKPIFTLSHLKQLSPELQPEGEQIRVVYSGFAKIACYLIPELGVALNVPYPTFLKNELFELMKSSWLAVKDIEELRDKKLVKDRWFEKSLNLVLGAICEGHNRIDQAFLYLKQGKMVEYAAHLAEAGVFYGRLTMIADLCGEGVYHEIGSIQSSLVGASLGGQKSGETRRKQSTVPSSADLRAAHQRLIDAGKPPREISAMLASKYGCTSDHIRKLLKRD